jgi:DNA-binding NtrC family response regulator
MSSKPLQRRNIAKQTHESNSNADPAMCFGPENATQPRILIVHDDDSVSRRLEVTLRHAGLPSERVTTIKDGCECAGSGRFQVVLTKPVLQDGSWKKFAELDERQRPGFIVILVSGAYNLNQWIHALDDGAFDVLDERHELTQVAEAARRALWAAYLKGAGPSPETLRPANVV